MGIWYTMLTMNTKLIKQSGQAAGAVLVTLAIIAVICLIVGGCSLTTVDAGQIGVRTQFGKVTENSVEPGLHFVNPIGGRIITYDVREQKAEGNCATYTKDMQQANIQIVATYALKKSDVGIVHQTFGTEYANRVVFPKIISAVKDVIGNIEAAELVNAREKAAKSILDTATAQVADAKVPVTITSLVITNIDYSDVFEKSIEEKVVAQQNAIRAQNETKRVEEEARQVVVRANAEAEAMKIRAQALKENQNILLQDFIKKWDGKFPGTLFIGGDASTVLDVGKFIKQ